MATHPTNHRFRDLTGRVFGSLTVKLFLHSKGGRAKWLCVCKCGFKIAVTSTNLLTENTKSCGCSRERQKTHGMTVGRCHGAPLPSGYISWVEMRQRCANPDNRNFKHYGGRGITVCARWSDFGAFMSDMGERPSTVHTIERKNVNGNYDPSNCVWATRAEQANNTRRNRHIEIWGRRLTLAQAAREFCISRHRLAARLALGWSPERACTAPRGG